MRTPDVEAAVAPCAPAGADAAVAAFRPAASNVELARRNRELYGDNFGPLWQLVVYEPLHGGWEFINLGGRRLLDELAERTGMAAGRALLELGSGPGDTCRYLAEQYGCAVTGVDLNRRMVRHARRRLRGAAPLRRGAVEFHRADVLAWQPTRGYDVVYSIDALMLVGDVAAFLATAMRALVPGGRLGVAVIMAGTRPDDRVLNWAWEEDGMISLIPAERHREHLTAAGFTQLVIEDVTRWAVDSSLVMEAALRGNREAIVSAHGEPTYRGWLAGTQTYLSCFREGSLVYGLMTARKPDVPLKP